MPCGSLAAGGADSGEHERRAGRSRATSHDRGWHTRLRVAWRAVEGRAAIGGTRSSQGLEDILHSRAPQFEPRDGSFPPSVPIAPLPPDTVINASRGAGRQSLHKQRALRPSSTQGAHARASCQPSTSGLVPVSPAPAPRSLDLLALVLVRPSPCLLCLRELADPFLLLC